MSEIDHELCRYLLRDQEVRAAEDAAAVPSIQHRDLPEIVAELRERVGNIEALVGKAAVAGVFDGVGVPPSPAEGLRTERVTLEVTHDINSRPVELATWVRSVVVGKINPGESVRVVDEADAASTEAMRCMTKMRRERDDARAERDAAIRERDAAKKECERLRAERDDALLVLPACCGRLSDAAATVVQERDHARSRVSELLKDCETYGRAVLALQGQLDLANARVAELEGAAARAANAGVEKQEPVAWGVMNSDGSVYEAFADNEVQKQQAIELAQQCRETFGLTKLPLAPLYAAPPEPRGWLTAEERETLKNAADAAESWWGSPSPSAKVIKSLLARSTPPRVKVPHLDDLEADERPVWESACHEWIAAIRAAGGEVEG